MKHGVILSVAFAVLCAGASVAFAVQDEVGTLAALTGAVEMKRSGEKTWVALKVTDPVYKGSVVRTGKESRARFLMKDQSVLALGESSELQINEYTVGTEKNSLLLTVFKGKLLSAVAKLTTTKSKFEIRTPTTVAGVRGTYLGTEVSGEDGRTELWVLSGTVNVRNLLDAGGRGIDVGAGFMTSVMPGVAPSPPIPVEMGKVRSFIRDVNHQLYENYAQNIDVKMMLSDALVGPVPTQGQGQGQGQKGPDIIFSSKAASAMVPPVRQESMKPDDLRVIITIQPPD